jgi:L-lactate utilization protein LutC
MTREAFLDRIRTAAAAGRAYRVAPRGEINDRSGYLGVSGDLVERFAAEVNLVGGHAHVAHDIPSVHKTLIELARKYDAQSALCWRHPVLDRVALDTALIEAGTKPLPHDTLAPLPPHQRQRLILAADIGITSADFAVAETGTLALFSKPGQERLASLAPPVHVAIIERAQILPDLFDLFERLGGELPSNLVLITGPSKTGDIELELTTGVHGPGHWHVIVLDKFR